MLFKSTVLFVSVPLATELGLISSLVTFPALGVGDEMTILFVIGASVFGLLDAGALHWWITKLSPFIWFRMPVPWPKKDQELPLAA